MHLLCVLFPSSLCHAIFAAWDGVNSGEAGGGGGGPDQYNYNRCSHAISDPLPCPGSATSSGLSEPLTPSGRVKGQNLMHAKQTNTEEAYRPTRTPKRGTVFNLISTHALISTHPVLL